MTDYRLATFRIDKGDWEAFKAWAKSRDSNASEQLNHFILASIGKMEPVIDDSLEDRLIELEQRLDLKIEAAIVNLEQKISTIPKNSPPRMASDERNEPVTTKDTKATPKTVTGAETMRCPECGSGDIKKTGYTQWTDKKTGKKYRSAARRQCKECKKSFSIPFPETIEV